MEDSFRQFLQRPEYQTIIENHQRKQALRFLKAKDRERAYGFRDKVLEAEYDVQKAIAPFLKIPALRTIVQTFTNDANGDFQKWAGNPSVLEMLTQAKRLLDEGHMTEAEMERAFLECSNAAPHTGSTTSPATPLKKTRLATDQLVMALNEHLTERRRGNEHFRKGLLDKAMCQYRRAHAVLDMVEGMGKDDQVEVDINKSAVLLNIAAVQLAMQEYAAAAGNCSAALELQPDSIKCLVRRAKCYSHMHEYKMATADLARVHELDPGNYSAKQVQCILQRLQQSGKRSETTTFTNMFHPDAVLT